jgi:hypothetical protein
VTRDELAAKQKAGRRPRSPATSLSEVLARLEPLVMAQTEPSPTDAHERELWQRVERLNALKPAVTARGKRLLLASKLEDTKFVQAARAWLQDPHPVLVLSGTVGRGKTLAAAEAALRRDGSAYVRARVAERYSAAKFGDEAREWERLVRCRGVLIFDDVGRERDSAEITAALSDVLDDRRGARDRTIICTNLTQKLFEERYNDERLLSRMHESALWIKDHGPDMRRIKK